ncbi:MAG: acetyl-CoA carboxylase biotin carboxylase subunit [Candidatus Sericytochromatia bacterium]|nr:acetyl-CoA carboxylase biotin carboxylase subunit [Candidatus Tanganyikabacteria bacterium]
MFRKVLIANRGEIALRVMRACAELGIKTVVIHSEADRDTLAVRLADEAVCIGPAATTQSYLNVPNIVSAAMLTGAEAVHPGYGLLSENARFAEICRDHGLKFIGPSPEAIAQMGDKIQALTLMKRLGVPTIPGSDGPVNDHVEAEKVAREMGYPVIIKAAAGGGGRGMRVVHNPRKFLDELGMAQSEALAAFGNGEVYLEKYLEEPRHIEIQILADRYGKCIHLGERDCSIQRRHQKLLEEAPSPSLTPRLRARMGEAALKAVKALSYEGVGTVEFLLDKYGNFYFMEMNTRIQVEHPVTEMITGLDLVTRQILVAAGEPLAIKQEDVQLRGHAIECRINAEDPARDFRPSPGTIDAYVPPGGPGVRVDSHCYPGYTIPPHYDSMIAKLVVWAEDRDRAIARMQRALGEYAITGVRTTIPIHQRILENAFFRKGEVYTNFLQRRILGG